MTLLTPTDDIVLHSTGNALDAAKSGLYVETLSASQLYKLVGAFPGVVARIRTRFIWDGLGPWTLGFEPNLTWVGGVTPAFDITEGAHVDIDFASVDNGASWTAQLVSAQSASVITKLTGTIPASGAAQSIDLTYVEIDETLTGDTVHTFINAQPGSELDLIITPDGVGNHTPVFPANVNWYGVKPSGPLLGPAGYHFIVGHNLKIYGQKFDIAPAAPNAPTINTAVPTDTTIGITFTPSPVTNGSTLTGYLFTVLDGATVVFTSTPGAGATSATATGLTQTHNYVVSLVSVSAAGNSPAATKAVKTLATAPPSAPSIPTSVVATGQDGKALLQWHASATGTPDHYVVQISLGGTGTPGIVQSVPCNNALGATSFLYNTTAATPGPIASNLGAANKLIVAVHDNDYTGTRTVTVGGTVGTGGSVTGGTAATRVGTGADDGGDAHLEFFEISTAAFAGTKPLVTYNRTSPGNVGPVEMEIYEVQNIGALDKVAVGTSTFPATAFPSGTTATLAQAVEFALAGWTFSNSPNTPTFSGAFAGHGLHNNDRGSTAGINTAATTGVTTTATVGSQDGIGMVATWVAAGGGGGFSFSDSVPSTSTLEYLFTLLTNGTTYNYSITPWNSAGAGTPATGTVTPNTVGGGGGGGTPGGIAAVHANIGQACNRGIFLTGAYNRWATFSPAGPISWVWATNTVVETDFGAYLSDFGVNAPVGVFRFGNDPAGLGGAGDFTTANVNSHSKDGVIDSQATIMQAWHNATGKAPIARIFYEGPDANWMPWSINRNGSVNPTTSVTNFCDAFARVALRVQAICPSAKIDITFNLTYGDGQDNAGNGGHRVWDNVIAGLQARGVHVDYVGWDCYSNGFLPTGSAMVTEQAMMLACAVRWGAAQGGTGCQISHGEIGIGDPFNSEGPHSWDAVVWVNAWVDWWASLPANVGGPSAPTPGSLGHIELFDLGGDLSNVGWRSFSYISNPTSNPDGPRAGNALKTRIQ